MARCSTHSTWPGPESARAIPETSDRAQRQRQRNREPGHLDRQLNDVDDGGGHEPACAEIGGHDNSANQASERLGNPDDRVEHACESDELSRENCQRADPEQGRDGRADACVVAPLEKIADGPQIVRRRRCGGSAVRPRWPEWPTRWPADPPTTMPPARLDSPGPRR